MVISPFSSYTHHRVSFILLVFLFTVSLPLFSATDTVNAELPLSNGFTRFLDAAKGSQVDGMSKLKSYFHRFGYLPHPPENTNFNDLFDEEFESAILAYQKNHGLSKTGYLDFETMKLVVSPRCGVADGVHHHHHIKTTRRLTKLFSKPRWRRHTPMMLTYAFSPTNTIDYISSSDLKATFGRAFARWSEVIPVSFNEVVEYSVADIKIDWLSGDHGDVGAFDGPLGVLAHAFLPEDGRIHFDAAERWSVDLKTETSKNAIDLESVATHEIGHVLGLDHSAVKHSIMYPTTSKWNADLQLDDVKNAQALYGSNPNYRFETDSSSPSWNEFRKSLVTWTSVLVMGVCLLSFGF